MQIKKPLVIGCAVAAIAVVVIGKIFNYANDLCYRNTFASADTAAARENTDKGWLPEWLPVTARNIQETHNLDNNQIVMKFDLDAEQIDQLKTKSRPASRDILVADPCTVKWWDRQWVHQNIKNGSFPVYERPNRRQDGN